MELASELVLISVVGMMDEMSENPPAILSENVDKQSAANLKHFVSLAESASGLKLVEVIKQVI